MCAVGVAVFIVFSQSATGRLFSVLKVENPSSLWMRKWFHLLALAVYIPGIIIDPPLLSLAASIVTVQFLVIELLRVFRIWPVGEQIHKVLAPFVDSRDEGELILTHIYLLLGFSIPVWLFPLSKLNTVVKMSMYAGTLSLGVGDSIAAVSGTLIGRNKWPGTKKTIEGTLMSVFCQIIIAGLIVLLDADLPPLSQYHWCVLGASIFLGAAMEAYTHQIDNLILGLFQFALCIAFL